ncbi:MAG TPA: hypothetical protein VEG27_07405 [Usitatibacter sp.]|nr:hypothetical protein [Usitatibacter sp.]
MSDRRDLLALRKEVLVARCSLQRLRLTGEAARLRESLSWPRAVAAAVASSRARSALFGLLWAVARGGRVARILRIAAIALGVAKVARALLAAAKPAPEGQVGPAEPTSAASSQSPEAAS